MKKIWPIIPLFILLFSISSCLKEEVFSPIPAISLNGFIFLQDTNAIINQGLLTINYQDGDGDIGLTEQDTAPPYQYNLFITYWEKQHDLWVALSPDPPLHGRIPILTPKGKNKNIKGTIQTPIYLNYLSNFDTIRLDIYLMDRAGHKSNIISTQPLIIPN